MVSDKREAQSKNENYIKMEDMKMYKFVLKEGSFEISKKNAACFRDLENSALWSDGASFDTISEFDNKADGAEALNRLVNTVYETSGRVGKLLCGSIYFLVEEEWDGEDFAQGGDCDVSPNWDDAKMFDEQD